MDSGTWKLKDYFTDMTNHKFIQKLSPHLFWDIDKNKVNPNNSEYLIVQRVLEYGLIEDWKLLVEHYGSEKIKKVALNLRSLEATALSFICTIYNLKKEEFRCYKHIQSNPHYWNY